MDPDFSFPNTQTINLAPPTSGQQKSRAKSMSDDPPIRRRPHHAHRRSAAVSEDLGKVKISASPVVSGGGEASSDRKVAFIEPPMPIPPLSPASGISTVSQYSPRRSSPRRRTMSAFLSEEPPCIDLDEALYSKALHRRTESLPGGLRSPSAVPPIIETLPEEDEERGREREKERERERRQVREREREHEREHVRERERERRGGSHRNHRNLHTLASPQLSCESEESSESNNSMVKEKKKRFSFFLPSPRKFSQSRWPRSRSPPRKLRNPRGVSNLETPTPELGLSSSAPASLGEGSPRLGFPLGEPGPLTAPSPERRHRLSLITAWVSRVLN